MKKLFRKKNKNLSETNGFVLINNNMEYLCLYKPGSPYFSPNIWMAQIFSSEEKAINCNKIVTKKNVVVARVLVKIKQ